MLRGSVRHSGDAYSAHARDRRVTLALRNQKSSREHTDPHDRVESVFPPPPPPLEDSRGGQRYLVEQLLNHRDVNRTSDELPRPVARVYPPSWDSWEPRSQLMVDVLGLVEQYDATHPVPQKDRRRKSSRHGRKKGFQVVNPFVHLSRDTYAPPRAGKETMQLIACTCRGSLFKLITSFDKFVVPSVTTYILEIMDVGVPRLK
uniref:Uncharacterized protein n=1 Tax=Peronospora matthiolae TaxID=2874970 RepID=A0AAV1TE87_9STRA